jgi:hypothetical protein
VYHYAANNPVKYTDPDGRDIDDYNDNINRYNSWMDSHPESRVQGENDEGYYDQFRARLGMYGDSGLNISKLTDAEIDTLYKAWLPDLKKDSKFEQGITRNIALGILAGESKNLPDAAQGLLTKLENYPIGGFFAGFFAQALENSDGNGNQLQIPLPNTNAVKYGRDAANVIHLIKGLFSKGD